MTSAESAVASPSDHSASPTETQRPVSATATKPSIFATADHKSTGRLLFGASLLFLLGGLAVGAVLRAELADGGYQILEANNDGQLFSAHATTMVYLFLLPAMLAAARFVVPLQLGARTSALPRVGAASAWGVIGGGLLVLVSYVVDGGPIAGLALISGDSLASVSSAGLASELWILGLALVVVSLIAGWIDVVVTVAYMRAAGLRLTRIPAFSFAAMVGGSVAVLGLPALLAGLLLLWIQLHHGATLFGAPGFDKAWRSTLWLYGQPALFVPLIVGAGALTDVVVRAAKRRPTAWTLQLSLIGVAGVGAFSAWLTDSGDSAANIFLPASSWATVAVYAPLAMLGLLWMATLAAGRAKPTAGLFGVVGAELVLLAAAVVGVVGAATDVSAGSQYTSAFLHLAVFAAPLVAVVVIGIHWAPKLAGVAWSAASATGVIGLVVLGSLISFAPGAAINEAPRLVGDNPDDTGLHVVMLVGSAILALGLLAFVVRTIATMLRVRSAPVSADGGESGLTLEWLAATPPAPENFDVLPLATSEVPLLEEVSR